MAFSPEVSTGVGIATAGLVFAIYNQATPSIPDIRAANPMNLDVDAGRKMAAWTATGIVAAISLITKDPTIFVIGGSTVIALDWWNRHANMVDPKTKVAVPPMSSKLHAVGDEGRLNG